MNLHSTRDSSTPEQYAAAKYHYSDARLGHAHVYLLPTLACILEKHFVSVGGVRRLFDLGCGNGSVAAYFSDKGYEVMGVDPSAEGIAEARAAFPHLQLVQGSAYDDLADQYHAFPAVISLEVVEHLYAPRHFAQTIYDLVDDEGIAVISTPYHGYLKNVAVAVSGNFDKHVSPLWDHGHIKFWSINTLTRLLTEVGFCDVEFHRVGRIPILAKSMIAVARKRK